MADNNKNCELHQFKRNNYFYGKLMTVDDFKLEQSYHDDKRYLINRLLHGSGVVCGFDLYSGTPGVSLSTNNNVEITFNKGGMVIDCCGYEIIVPIGTKKTVLNPSGKALLTSELSTNKYLYIRYKEDEGELVAAASSPSSCEGMCTATRIIEDFDILAFPDAPPEIKRECSEELQFPEEIEKREFNENDGWEKIRDWFQSKTGACQSCVDDRKVFFALINKDEGGKFIIDAENARVYSLPLSNTQLISELVMCHVSDLGNPHNTKHADLYKILPINPDVDNNDRDKHVSNNDAKRWNSAILTLNDEGPENNGNFTIDKKDTITLTQNKNHKIIIGERHSGIKPGNPHETRHGDLYNIEQVNPADTNQDKNKHLSNANAKKWEDHANSTGNPHQTNHSQLLNVGQVDPEDTNQERNKHLSNADAKKWEDHTDNTGNPHQTPHSKLLNVGPVDPTSTNNVRDKHLSNADAKKWDSSVFTVSEVGPDGNGNLTLEQGENITIKPNKDENKITIASHSGTDCITGVVVFRNVPPGQERTSPEIELPSGIIWGIILAVEQKHSPDDSGSIIITDVYSENILSNQDITISTHLTNVSSNSSVSKNTFTISLSNQSKEAKVNTRVRWWAILPTEEREEEIMVPLEPPSGLRLLNETTVKNDISLHPGITIKDIATNNNINDADVEKIINPLLEKKVIRAEGKGAKRKFRLNL